jgi:hypothetical protein
MFIRKLSAGVLRVITPLGPRYIKLTFFQRLYFTWIFRHFEILPLQVLSNRQQALVDALCAQQQFLAMHPSDTVEDIVIIGSVERRPRVEVEALPPCSPSVSPVAAVASLTTNLRQRS